MSNLRNLISSNASAHDAQNAVPAQCFANRNPKPPVRVGGTPAVGIPDLSLEGQSAICVVVLSAIKWSEL